MDPRDVDALVPHVCSTVHVALVFSGSFNDKIDEAGAHVEGVRHMTVFPDNSNESVTKQSFLSYFHI